MRFGFCGSVHQNGVGVRFLEASSTQSSRVQTPRHRWQR